MADSPDTPSADPTRAFLKHLDDAGFFRQLTELEQSLAAIAGELKTYGDTASERMRETENLAAHVLAIEAVLATLLKTYPVDAEEVAAAVKDRTAEMSGDAEGSPTVRSLALGLLPDAED